MNTNIELKDLWQQKETVAPNLRDMYNLASKAKRMFRKKIILSNIILGLTAALVIAIWIYSNPQMLTTKLGICLTILAISSFILAQNQVLPLLKKEKDNLNLSDYLSQLKKLRQKERFLQTTMMNVYFILLTSGVLLYMYEYTSKARWFFILGYSIIIAWFAFNWFYLRPRIIKKQQKNTNLLIEKFESIEQQLNE